MWQYTNQGRVAGIGTNVDINVAYFGYSESNGSLSGETAAAASPDVEAGMVFTSVNDTVTAKDEVRLRDKPSQDTDATGLEQAAVAGQDLYTMDRLYTLLQVT